MPVTVRVNVGPATDAELGLSEVIAGGGTTLKVMLLEVPPPGGGLKTAIVAVVGENGG